jgi:hypothetical protein
MITHHRALEVHEIIVDLEIYADEVNEGDIMAEQVNTDKI